MKKIRYHFYQKNETFVTILFESRSLFKDCSYITHTVATTAAQYLNVKKRNLEKNQHFEDFLIS